MRAFFIFTFLLGLSLASAANFTPVLEWGPNELELNWKSAEERTKAVQDGTYRPENMNPNFMAVHAGRIFFSFFRHQGVPVSLAWLPSTSAAPPKLTPFPSWEFHQCEDCSCIQQAKGVEVDARGRLWVLDNGNMDCPAKLWIFNLEKNNRLELVHQFPDSVVPASLFLRELLDIALDETPDDLLGYFTDTWTKQVTAFSLRTNQSWAVKTEGKTFNSIALSREEGQKRLFLGREEPNQLYSVPVSELRERRPTATLTLIGPLSAGPYRTIIDSGNVWYAAFLFKNYLSSWKVTEAWKESRFYEAGRLVNGVPITFALDRTETLWLMERNGTNRDKPTYRLLTTAVGARP